MQGQALESFEQLNGAKLPQRERYLTLWLHLFIVPQVSRTASAVWHRLRPAFGAGCGF
jgi:hypothetical protein